MIKKNLMNIIKHVTPIFNKHPGMVVLTNLLRKDIVFFYYKNIQDLSFLKESVIKC